MDFSDTFLPFIAFFIKLSNAASSLSSSVRIFVDKPSLLANSLKSFKSSLFSEFIINVLMFLFYYGCKDTNTFGLDNQQHPFIAPPPGRNGGIKGGKKKLG